MGVEKFFNDDFGDKIELENEKEELYIRESDYKDKVNLAIESKFHLSNNDKNVNDKNGFDLMTIEANQKKIPMSFYINEDDLLLLKAIAFNKNTTVNKIVLSILEEPLSTTRKNLNSNFDIEFLANKYDKKCRRTKRKAD